MLNAAEILKYTTWLAERREALCKEPPLCPDCRTDQVQLIEWIEEETAEWKCRHCRTRFKFERVLYRNLPEIQLKNGGI